MRRVALAPRTVRQLRRVRSVYAAGAVLSALVLILEEGRPASGRQTEFAGILLGAFVVLLGVTVIQLWRHSRTDHCSTAKRLTSSA
ncbi:hypothetical protein [uncultured Streptomyces sp.]|uniref:hypothetical protein n=1 Tax=uncultured Streptomyces sp. TaxID=174707 RepID=UPI00343C63FC